MTDLEGGTSVGIYCSVSLSSTSSFRRLYRRIHLNFLEYARDNGTLYVYLHLDKRSRDMQAASCSFEGRTKRSNEAFFRSLLAFYGEGLYEVPYIEDI